MRVVLVAKVIVISKNPQDLCSYVLFYIKYDKNPLRALVLISHSTLTKSVGRISVRTYFYFHFITRLIVNMGYGFAERTDRQKPATVNY